MWGRGRIEVLYEANKLSVTVSWRCLDIKGSEDLGYWVNDLPRGCQLCMAGAKSVLFITGMCGDGCYYCPISPQRKGKDVVYVNDVAVSDLKDVVEEVANSMSEGIGITGGDPLLVLDRVVKVVKVLKDVFGRGFHVHLYTPGTKLGRESMEALVSAGVDEVRIHVISSKSRGALRLALEYPVDVVVENPVIPDGFSELRELIEELNSMGVRYVNLNELEVSESNIDSLNLKGFRVSEDGRSVLGSRSVAMDILRWVKEAGLDISVHYCPAIYKDAYQYPRRLHRRAIATRRVFEEVEGGLVRWAELPLNTTLSWLYPAGIVFRAGDTVITHPRVAEVLRSGRVIEGLPLTPRRPLNEYPVVD